MAKRDSNILTVKLLRIGKTNFNNRFNTQLSSISGHPASISPLWSLPDTVDTNEYKILDSFRKLYIGERFSACLRVSNVSQSVNLEKIIVSCHLQYSGLKTFPLLFQTEIPTLGPSISQNYGFSLCVDRPDVYYLSLQVNFYVRELPEPALVRKMFKFDAKTPIEFKNSSYRTEDYFIIQAKLSNFTNNPLHLNDVDFIPGSDFTIIPIPPGLPISIFNPGEVRSYLYKLADKGNLPAQVDLGSLSVSWYNSIGDVGNLTSTSLSHTFRLDKTLGVSIENKPKFFHVEKPTLIKLKISNKSTNLYLEDVIIQLNERDMRNVILTPISKTIFPRIAPAQFYTVDVALFAKVPGIQLLEGISVTVSQRPWEIAPCEIYVKAIEN